MGPRGLLAAAVHIYVLIIVVRAIFSWLPPEHRANEFYRFLFAITEPLLSLVRRVLPGAGRIDFAPLIAILLLEVVRRLLLG